jgi:hypothetical protein
MNRSYIFGQKHAIPMLSTKDSRQTRTLLSGFHAVFKGESSMTAILPSPLPARSAPLMADSPARTEKPNLPQSPPTIPTPSTRHQLPTIVSPRKEPPTSSGQIARLRGEPTEPPKQTLNGRNRPLNGAVHFRPVGQVPDLPYLGLFCISSLFITFSHFSGKEETAKPPFCEDLITVAEPYPVTNSTAYR